MSKYRERGFILDLDSTLFNIDHRVKYVLQKPKDWVNFRGQIPNDKVDPFALQMVYGLLNVGYKAIIITGRSNVSEVETKKQLKDLGISNYDLHMRKPKDYSPSHKYKRRVYKKHVEKNYYIIGALDDDPNVCRMFTDLGISVFRPLFSETVLPGGYKE